MGRPSKLTPEVTKTITDAIAIGATYQAAAEYAGISLSTFNDWLVRPEKFYREFSEAVRQAEARGQIRLLAEIQKADDWRSKAWILERRHKDAFSLKVQQEVSGDPDKPQRLVIEVIYADDKTDPAAPAPGADAGQAGS
jgi:hypothetical protein